MLSAFLYGFAPPPDESVGADDHRPGSGDSIRVTERVRGIDEIACLTADLIAVQREMEGVSCVACSRLPLLSLWADEQDEVGAKQVSRRDRLPVSFEYKMCGVGTRLLSLVGFLERKRLAQKEKKSGETDFADTIEKSNKLL